MKIELWPIEKVTPYAKNARKLSKLAVDKVGVSIKEFGWRQPIVVDANGVIVCGHTRLLAAKKLGFPIVPVHVASDLTEAQVEYDPTWRDGKGGFSTAPVIQRGLVQNDERADWSAAFRLFPGDVAYVWHASLRAAEVWRGLELSDFVIRACIIWSKQQAVFSQGHYHWQHEPCLYGVRNDRTAHWHGDRKQSTIWNIQNLNPTGNRTEERVGHGTQKPIELMRRPILNHTEPGEAVYDPFLGSGTTLIAAEATQRTCYGLEIDPVYVDVIVRRWQTFTGREATLESDGRTFAQIAQARTAVAA